MRKRATRTSQRLADLDRVVCAVLVASRHDAGLTQRELAAKLELPQAILAKVERGHRRLTVSEFIRLAAALEVSPSTLLERVQSW